MKRSSFSDKQVAFENAWQRISRSTNTCWRRSCDKGSVGLDLKLIGLTVRAIAPRSGALQRVHALLVKTASRTWRARDSGTPTGDRVCPRWRVSH
jgi:hypothetical protein